MADKIDPVLYQLSRDYVGDTAETVSLLWPDRRDERPSPRLAEVVAALELAPRNNVAPIIGDFLDRLDVRGRWALLKLVGGAPRVGVSARLAKTALAQMSGHELSDIEEMWHALSPPYADLFAWLDNRGPRPSAEGKPVFRPLMLSHPIEEGDWAGLNPDEISRPNGSGTACACRSPPGAERCASSRARATTSRPASRRSSPPSSRSTRCSTASCWSCATASWRRSTTCSSASTARPSPTKMLRDYPAFVRLYDMLIDGDEDVRPLPFAERRARLEAWHARHHPRLTDVSALVPFDRLRAPRRIVERHARGRHRGPDAEAQVEPLRLRPAEGALVEVEARGAHRRLRADVRPARLRQALVLLFRLHLRRLARDDRRERRAACASSCRSARPTPASPTRS